MKTIRESQFVAAAQRWLVRLLERADRRGRIEQLETTEDDG